jgi:hypothetical protein
MGWRPWELRQIEHPREFIEAVQGYQWRMSWELDLAAFVAFHTIAASGSKREDGTTFQPHDVLGRALFAEPLVPQPQPSEEQREEEERERAERFAKAERAKMQMWAAMKAKEAIARGEDPGPWQGR